MINAGFIGQIRREIAALIAKAMDDDGVGFRFDPRCQECEQLRAAIYVNSPEDYLVNLMLLRAVTCIATNDEPVWEPCYESMWIFSREQRYLLAREQYYSVMEATDYESDKTIDDYIGMAQAIEFREIYENAMDLIGSMAASWAR